MCWLKTSPTTFRVKVNVNSTHRDGIGRVDDEVPQGETETVSMSFQVEAARSSASWRQGDYPGRADLKRQRTSIKP